MLYLPVLVEAIISSTTTGVDDMVTVQDPLQYCQLPAEDTYASESVNYKRSIYGISCNLCTEYT